MNAITRKPETLAFLNRVVMHDRLDRIDEAIRRAHATHGLRPKSLVLVGPPGVGKTTLIERYRKQVPSNPSETHDHIPVLLVEVPPSPDLRSFQMQMLRALRYPRPDRRATLGEMRTRIVRLIQTLGVELIIVDEFHDLLPRRNRHSPAIIKLLKHFMNELAIPWVLVGLPESVEILESGDGQLRRRFSGCRDLAPFSIVTDEHVSEFAAYLSNVESVLPVPSHHLSEPNMVLRMYCATHGLPGLITNVLERLIENHPNKGKATLKDFALAYAQAFIHDVPVDDGGLGFNPFTAPIERVRQAVGA